MPSASNIVVTKITATHASAIPGAGDAIQFDLALSGAAAVAGTPQLLLSDGTVAHYNAALSTPANLVFDATIPPGDNASDLQVVGLSHDHGLVTTPATFTTPATYDTVSNRSVHLDTTTTLANGSAEAIVSQVNFSSPDQVFAATADAAGSFGPLVSTGVYGSWAQAADVNGDGTPDILAAATVNGSVVIEQAIGNADGTFGAVQTIQTGLGDVYGFKTADLARNGHQDLVVLGSLGTTGQTVVEVLSGNGDGTYATPVSIPLALGNFQAFTSFAVVPLTDGGAPEIIVSGTRGNGVVSLPPVVAVAANNGAGGFSAFAPATNIGAGGDGGVYGLQAADLTGNGIEDLVNRNSAGAICVQMGDGHGGFAPATIYTLHANGFAIGDFNGDSVWDIGVSTADGAQILLGDGHGDFSVQAGTISPSGVSGSFSWGTLGTVVTASGLPGLVAEQTTTTSTGVLLSSSLVSIGNTTSTAFDSNSVGTAPGADTGIAVTSAIRLNSITANAGPGAVGPNSTVLFTLALNQAVTVAGTPSLALSNGGVATYASGSGSSALVFSYTTGPYDPAQDTASLVVAPRNALTGTITNQYGDTLPANAADGQGAALNLGVGPAAPSITAVSPNAQAFNGAIIDAGTLTLSGTATPGLRVNILDGGSTPAGSAVADASGNWTVSLPPGTLQPGFFNLTAVALDANNLPGVASAPVSVVQEAAPDLVQTSLTDSVAEGTTVSLSALLTANGAEATTSQPNFKVTSVDTTGTQGTVAFNAATGALSYTAYGLDPARPTDSLGYTLTDEFGNTVSGTLTIDVTGPALTTLVGRLAHRKVTATGANQVLISENTGQTLAGSSAGNDLFFGGADTTITASGSGNVIHAKAGNHTITAGVNNNTVTLASGNNTIKGTGAGNTVTAGDGNDKVTGFTGATTVTLGNGNDTVTLTGAGNSVTVGNGTSQIHGGTGGNETVTAGDGAMSITIGGANDTIIAGTGADTIVVTGANATVTAADGNNSIKVTGAGAKITAGAGNNLITDVAGGAMIKTGLGNDTIKFGGTGNTIDAGGGMNTLTETGRNNTIVLPGRGAGVDVIIGKTLTNGDYFDLTAAMASTAWQGNYTQLGNYLSVTQASGQITIAVDPTGVTGGPATTVAILTGYSLPKTETAYNDVLTHTLANYNHPSA